MPSRFGFKPPEPNNSREIYEIELQRRRTKLKDFVTKHDALVRDILNDFLDTYKVTDYNIVLKPTVGNPPSNPGWLVHQYSAGTDKQITVELYTHPPDEDKIDISLLRREITLNEGRLTALEESEAFNQLREVIMRETGLLNT